MESYKTLLKTLLGSNVVRYYPILAGYVGGAKAGLMLSQLLYWYPKYDNEKYNGWFYISVPDMKDQIGLTKGEQQTARKRLIEAGVIEAKLKGIPRQWHYKPNLETLAELVGKAPPHWEGIVPNVETETPPIAEGKPAQLNEEDTNEDTNKDNKQDRAKPPIPKPKKKRDPLLDHPAIIAHKEIIRLNVPIIFREAVVNVVGDSPASLNRWKQTLRDWIGSGYNPKAIKNILHKFQGGKPKRINQAEDRQKYVEGEFKEFIEH